MSGFLRRKIALPSEGGNSFDGLFNPFVGGTHVGPAASQSISLWGLFPWNSIEYSTVDSLT